MSIIRNVDDTGYLFISVKKTNKKNPQKQPVLQQQLEQHYSSTLDLLNIIRIIK